MRKDTPLYDNLESSRYHFTNTSPDPGCNSFSALKIIALCIRSELNCHSYRLVDNLFFRLEALVVPDIIRKFE